MHYPHTPFPLDAFMAAHASLAVILSAVLWFRPLRPWPASIAMLLAIWMLAIVPVEPDMLTGVGFHLAPHHVAWLMRAATLLAAAAMLIARPRWIAVPALLGAWALSRASGFIPLQDAVWETASLHLAWLAFLLGLHAWRAYPGRATPMPMARSSRRGTDIALFFGAAILAGLVSTFVLFREPGSGDEWADIYQADLFAHFKAYGTPPPCPAIFQSFWVFFYMGRSFCQYTPGWPLVLAPFQRLGVPWLANAVLLGALAVGVARVARRAVAYGIGGAPAADERYVRAAGVIAAATATLGASMLLNAGSEYPHPFVAACFAWAVESVAAMASPDSRARDKWIHGLVLGAATSLMAAARPGEGGALGAGVFLFFAYALVRRRFGLRALLATAATFSVFAALTLVILRLQLGEWWKTGYSITGNYHPWAVMRLAAAAPGEMKYVLPLGTGAYMWWPAAPALGVAGLAAMRGRGRGLAFMLTVGPLGMLVLFFYNGFTHSASTGYGPRMHLPMVVPMAVGAAVLLAPLWVAARKRGAMPGSALRTGGPAAVALVAAIAGTLRIAPLVYPPARGEMSQKTAPLRAIRAAHLHDAVVTITRGQVYADPMDLVQNYATDPDPDVLIVHEFAGPEIGCGKERWARRQWWKVSGQDTATLSPE